MEDRSGQGAQRPRRRGPRQPGNKPADAKDDGLEAAGQVVQLKGLQSLERLRERVETAAGELKRLREENAALAARIAQIEAGRGAHENEDKDEDGTRVQFDEDPEALRRKVSGFIEAIDQYLQANKRD